MATYTTIQGDTWDIIALRTLGSETEMGRLINANIEQADRVIFPAGIRLTIPEEQDAVSNLLPPWKR